jgi:hypothetical protein
MRHNDHGACTGRAQARDAQFVANMQQNAPIRALIDPGWSVLDKQLSRIANIGDR